MALEIIRNKDALRDAVDQFRRVQASPCGYMAFKEASVDLLREVASEISSIHPDSRDFDSEMSGVIENLIYEFNSRIDDENNPDTQAANRADMRRAEMAGK